MDWKYHIRLITPPEVAESLLVGMMNNTYQVLSTKNNTRNQRGEDHIKTFIGGFEQYVSAGMKWNEL